MSNPLFGMFGNQTMMNPVMQRFQQFQRMFSGDPRQKVQELLNSGKVSQEQYNRAAQLAQQMQRMMGIR